MLKTVRGVTMIELVTTIVIISVAVVILLALTSRFTGRSVDPMIQTQANAIAQAYFEEISQKNFCDPNWDPDNNPNTPTLCATACLTSACGGCKATGSGWTTESRSMTDDICDYAGMTDVGARNQSDLLITGLDQYTVNINVVDDNTATLGPAGNQLSGNNGQVVRIDINVSHPAMQTDVRISGFKTNF